ncbi:hypothetical protein [Legionella sp. PC997]|uniref:hypothetical protein n=1 Tax=Legionella sp. PC997 TaxID=2755562 RepID=UPI0015F90F8B|nr:hypothetical protein [Legionella sp. PC997]QMT61614.1 hypothetical protein HBNCFIEN_03018 [Legionella sp. PC997]
MRHKKEVIDTPKNTAKQSNSLSSEIANFKVFVFQPDEEFFSSSFEERLNILEKRILLAKKTLQETASNEMNHPSTKSKKTSLPWSIMFKVLKKEETQLKPPTMATPRAIFVAPEYLFKDQSETCYHKYYSQTQKNLFKKRIQELSKDTDMLIAPGTFCWYKKSKHDSQNYYRNTAYFFHRGQVEKYKKRYPHTNYDFDYTDEGFLNYLDLRRIFFKSGMEDTLVKEFSGLKLGVEICYDSVQSSLSNFVNDNNISLDVQLIIADGAEKPNLVARPGTLFIKVEKKAAHTEIGTIINTSDSTIGIQPAIYLGDLEENDLKSFKFR